MDEECSRGLDVTSVTQKHLLKLHRGELAEASQVRTLCIARPILKVKLNYLTHTRPIRLMCANKVISSLIYTYVRILLGIGS